MFRRARARITFNTTGFPMQIISPQKLDDFAQRHPNSKSGLNHWRKWIEKCRFGSINDVRQVFPHADLVKRAVSAHPQHRGPRVKQEITFTVFNIGGNKARLVAIMQYKPQWVTVHEVFTHAEYNAWMKKR